MSTHADLSFHVLRYALQRVHDGDLSAALDLGFTIDEIRSMEALTLNDLEHLSRLSAHFLRVQVDHDTLPRDDSPRCTRRRSRRTPRTPCCGPERPGA
jgi:hypothetical protein